MKYKNLLLITAFSLLACVLHSLMLLTQFNQYAYTSGFKLFLFILFPVIYFAVSKEGKFKDLFFLTEDSSPIDKKYIKVSFVLAFLAFALILIGFFIMRPMLDQSMIIGALSDVGITENNFIPAFVYYALVNAALEELFFRGFIFITLYRMNFKIYAHVYSALLFAVYHIAVMKEGVTPGLLILAIVGLVVVGLMFNELTRRCRSIIGSYAVHVGAGVAISLIGVYILI